MSARDVVHVVSYALPREQGYSLRTHGVCLGLREHGWRATVLLAQRSASRGEEPYASSGRYEKDGVLYLAAAGSPGALRRAVAGAEHAGIPGTTALGRTWDARRIARELAAQGIAPRMVHVHTPPEIVPEAKALARALGVPCVYEIRGFWELTSAADEGRGADVDAATARDVAAALAVDGVVAISAVIRDLLIRHGARRDRVVVAPNGVDPGAEVPAGDVRALRTALGLDGCRVAGTATSVRRLEGLDVVVAAWPLVTGRVPEARLLIVGDGPHLGALRDLAQSTGCADSVIFAGRVPAAEVATYLALLDAFVVPRRAEPVSELVTPLKPLQGMAAGVPVVASDLAALREMVEPDRTGVLVPPGDSDAWADALTTLFTDAPRRERLAQEARRFALANRSWGTVTAPTAALYDALLGGRP